MVADACFDVVAARDGSLPVLVLPSVPQVREGLSLLSPDPVSQVFMMLATVSRHANKAKVYLLICCFLMFTGQWSIIATITILYILWIAFYYWDTVPQQWQGSVVCTDVCLIVCLTTVTRSSCLHSCLFDCLSINSDNEQ